ncbi:unnamed protein product [Meganyctiphanes norvegica]|uniref:Uncharacterized protein n=1 Tax=Meganyctiphanes norvegica TaxID=48144 RepID=A0AAV2RAY7_MEGNR
MQSALVLCMFHVLLCTSIFGRMFMQKEEENLGLIEEDHDQLISVNVGITQSIEDLLDQLDTSQSAVNTKGYINSEARILCSANLTTKWKDCRMKCNVLNGTGKWLCTVQSNSLYMWACMMHSSDYDCPFNATASVNATAAAAGATGTLNDLGSIEEHPDQLIPLNSGIIRSIRDLLYQLDTCQSAEETQGDFDSVGRSLCSANLTTKWINCRKICNALNGTDKWSCTVQSHSGYMWACMIHSSDYECPRNATPTATATETGTATATETGTPSGAVTRDVTRDVTPTVTPTGTRTTVTVTVVTVTVTS